MKNILITIIFLIRSVSHTFQNNFKTQTMTKCFDLQVADFLKKAKHFEPSPILTLPKSIL